MERLNAIMVKRLRSDESGRKWQSLDLKPLPSTPLELARFGAEDSRRWARAVQLSGFKPTSSRCCE